MRGYVDVARSQNILGETLVTMILRPATVLMNFRAEEETC
jgi:hypothetical protein